MIKLSEEQIENAPDFMPVVGYEGRYEVGKDGSVWSLNYHLTGQRKQLRLASNKYGYLFVGLCKDGKMKNYKVHRLILDAYIPKPSAGLEVMHLDSNPANNYIGNLAWGSHKENMNDPHRKALQSLVQTNHPNLSIPVVCVETGEQYPSVKEAERQTGIGNSSISKCLNGKHKTAGGYHWRNVKEC